LKNGVYAQIGKQFSLDGSDVRAVRLGFALHDEKTLKSAVRVLAKSLPI
jgi:DNA-binding transcriptional MocR family regulator